jgi:Protein of unknown function (DUF4038)
MVRVFSLTISLLFSVCATGAEPFQSHGQLKVAPSGTYLQHADGTPFFFVGDTCWTGPAMSDAKDWERYLADRKQKGFNVIQFKPTQKGGKPTQCKMVC